MPGLIPSTETDDANRLTRLAPGGAATPDDAPAPSLLSTAGTFGKNVGMLGMQGFANTVRSVDLLGGAVPALYGAVTGNNNPTDAYFARTVTPATDAVNFWTPDPKSTNAATNIVGGLLKIGTEAMSGGAASMIGSEQVGTALDLVDKGVDAGTANTVGQAVGVTNAIGLNFGGFGGNWMTRVASNFAGNAALSMANTATERATLQDAGYADEAKAFNVWDPHARQLDFLTGAVMAAFHRGDTSPVTRATLPEQDAVLTAANANRVQTTSAPARPANAAGADQHVSAFDAAVAAAARGEKVDVAATINPADFHVEQPNPAAAAVVSAAHSSTILANLTGTRATVRDAAVAAGADPQTTLAIAHIESNFDPAVKNPNSSAAGIGQFLDSTWKAMGGTAENRFDASTQARLLAELTVKNTDDLRAALGREPQPQEVYLAHLLGLNGAKKALNAAPDALMANVAGKKVADGNGMAGMTVAQALDHWKQKLDVAGTEPVQANSLDTPKISSEPPTTSVAAPATDATLTSQDGSGGSSIAADDTPTAGAVKTGIQADFETARQTAEANPDLVVHDENGAQMLARDAIAQTDADLADADHFSQAYEIAINCALRGGH